MINLPYSVHNENIGRVMQEGALMHIWTSKVRSTCRSIQTDQRFPHSPEGLDTLESMMNNEDPVRIRRLVHAFLFAHALGKLFGLQNADLNHEFVRGMWMCIKITKTCLYKFDPLKPHFYIVKLEFKGVYIIFLISAQKYRLWVRVRTASLRRF